MGKLKTYLTNQLGISLEDDDFDYQYDTYIEDRKQIASQYFPDGCNICKSPNVILVDSIIIYPRSYGNIYFCMDCGAYVGVHKENTETSTIDQPLGTLADDKTRKARVKLHSVIDPIYKNKYLSRKQTYHFLSGITGISKDKTHIGMFSENQINEILNKLEKFTQFLQQQINQTKNYE